MRKHSTNPQKKFLKQGKFKHFVAQKTKFHNHLKKHTVTCSMAARAIRVPQKNLTRFKRQYQKAGLLVEVKKSVCRLTGFRAAYLSTNPDLIIAKKLKP
jgi:hypothetical protein